MCSIEPGNDSKCLPVPAPADDAPVYDVTPPVTLDHATGAPCVPVGPSGDRVMIVSDPLNTDDLPEFLRGTRVAWKLYITADGQTAYAGYMQSGSKVSVASTLSSAISFLLAAAESYAHYGPECLTNPESHARMFPIEVTLWAHQMSDELAVAQMELEGNL